MVMNLAAAAAGFDIRRVSHEVKHAFSPYSETRRTRSNASYHCTVCFGQDDQPWQCNPQ